MFTDDQIDFDLIKKHLIDMLQVAISIIEGRISPSFILRRLVVGLGKISFFMPLESWEKLFEVHICSNIYANQHLEEPSIMRQR